MKRLAFIVFALLLTSLPSGAATIYLKNGRIITGVGYYETTAGHLKFYYMGGQVSLPLKDVKKIEEDGKAVLETEPSFKADTPPPGAQPQGEAAPAKTLTPEATSQFKDKIDEIDRRLAEINMLEDRKRKLEAEYEEVKLRVEVLWQKGRKNAIAAGQGEASWFVFLDAQERQWSQLNTIRKGEIEAELEALNETLKPLLEEKASIVEYKKELEGELRRGR